MKNIIKLLSICLVCGVCSCSDLTFGDKFLGSQPESSGAVLDSGRKICDCVCDVSAAGLDV